MLYRREGSAFWWLKFNYRGQTFRRSTDQADRADAERAARQIRAGIEKDEGPQPGADGVTLAVLSELHVQHVKGRGFDRHRVKDIENLWRHLFAHLGGEQRDATTLTVDEVEGYEGARKSVDKVRGQTIRRERQALRKGLSLAKRGGYVGRLPFDWDDLEVIESDAPLRQQEAKTRSDAVIAKVLAALSRKAKTAGHDKMLRFLRLTGLRLEEFRRYEPSWLHPAPRGSKAAALLVVPPEASKTNEGRVLPLTDEALGIAKRWGGEFKGKKFNHALWLASAEAGVSPPLTPRDLRATYITHVARRDVTAAQRLAGHTNVATTGRYVELDALEAIETGIAVLPVPTRKRGGRHRGSAQSKQRRRRA